MLALGRKDDASCHGNPRGTETELLGALIPYGVPLFLPRALVMSSKPQTAAASNFLEPSKTFWLFPQTGSLHGLVPLSSRTSIAPPAGPEGTEK